MAMVQFLDNAAMQTGRSVSESALRSLALAGWREADPARKAELALALGEAAAASPSPSPPPPQPQPQPQPFEPPAADLTLRPGRPVRPRLVPPLSVPKRSVGSERGRAALLHAVAHIEFNAIDLALDAVWRFDDVPPAFRIDWASVAADEARHFAMVRGLLQARGFDYGDFDAHDGLWAMAMKTRHDVLARMAMVPRVLEARGLDATPPIQARLAKVGDAAAVDVLQVILEEEVRHVAIGNRWFRWACGRRGVDPMRTFEALMREHDAPRPSAAGMNRRARLEAGFSEAELDALALPPAA
jgi:uncharacterized ferritin-like protein (DUF455 family)